MDNRRKILAIIIVVVIMIIILVTFILINLLAKTKNIEGGDSLAKEQQAYINTIENPGMVINGKKPIILKVDNMYYTIDDCVKKYLSYSNEGKGKELYDILNKQYKEKNEITSENVLNKAQKYEDTKNYETNIIYVLSGPRYSMYYVEGKINKNNVYFIVNIDDNSKAFDIIPSSQSEYNEKINEIVQTNQKEEDTIEKNTNNTIPYKYYAEEEIVNKYLQKYLEEVLYNPEKAYNSLDENYRNKKFGNIENYKEYIAKNKTKLELMCEKARKQYEDFENYEEYEKYYSEVARNGLAKYKINNKNEGKQYICIDTNGSYYIFNTTNIMQYTLILDTYTIDLPEFIEKYEKASNEDKVLMNIQRFFSAIDDGDYKYAYSKLDETYKTNKFKTQADFENYVKNTFFEKNKLAAGKPEKQGDIYLYNITISDASGKDSKTVTTSFVMQLKEGTDFVMSFGA